MKKKISLNQVSWLLACLGILLMTGFVFAHWQNVSGNVQEQSTAASTNPDQQFINGLQEMLAKDNLSAEDRANLQQKLEMLQRLESQRQANSQHNGPKPTGPNVPPNQSPQLLTVNRMPEEGIFEGSGGLVHPWQANVVNFWQKTIDSKTYQVLAGSQPDDTSQGILIVMVSQNKGLGREQQIYLPPEKTGALHITSVSGMMLSLLDESGVTWVFNLNTRDFQK